MTELLGALPLAAAERSPDAQALKAGRRSCSYAELAAAVRDFAGGLLALGGGRQDRVDYWNTILLASAGVHRDRRTQAAD